MADYAKIDRDTQKIIKRKSYENPKFTYTKKYVWLEVDKDVSPPEYDVETEKLERVETIPDLTDIDKNNPPKVTVRLEKSTMTEDEKKAFARTRLELDDTQPACCDVDYLYQALIAKGVISENDVSEHLKDHMAERARLRGLAGIE
tara:strand:- start:39 stop:476 length:438 start_codon:yes stop_codon:yes gene_type:complete